jgi:hypothetical protein
MLQLLKKIIYHQAQQAHAELEFDSNGPPKKTQN